MLQPEVTTGARTCDSRGRTPIDANGWLPTEFTAASITGRDDLQAANDLYCRVFGYDDSALTLNPHLLMSVAAHGGTSIGVFDAHDELVGFAYGFPGRDGNDDYQFSQAAVVSSAMQGRGIGRALKRLQARVAGELGYGEMRWTFDPMLARNAHFNLDALGATGIRFLPEYYGSAASDRVLVRWQLPANEGPGLAVSPPSLGQNDWGTPHGVGDEAWVAVPSDLDRVETRDDELAIRASLAATLHDLCAAGFVLTNCVRVNDDTAAYRAVRQRGRHHG